MIHPMSLGFAQTYPGVVVRGPRMGNLQGEQGKETEKRSRRMRSGTRPDASGAARAGHAVKDDQTIVHLTSVGSVCPALSHAFRCHRGRSRRAVQLELKGTSTMRAD